MLFRQLFDYDSWTYTYLLADETSRAAVIIDPVNTQVESYVQLLRELNLTLVLSIETHTHADHITGSGKLRELTGCQTRVGAQSKASCASGVYHDGDVLAVDGVQLQVLYTPGHTDDSYSFLLQGNQSSMVFTGDTLLIRGCGRTDFQNGNAGQQYDSLLRLLALPADTRVFPGHDYRGWHESTVAEEGQHNPRMQVTGRDAFINLMGALKLSNPKMMDIAVPANQQCGNV